MNKIASCPDAAFFQMLSRGELPSDDVAEFSRHTDSCQACTERIANLGQNSHSAQIDELISKCKSSSYIFNTEIASGDASTRSGEEIPAARSADDELAFLSPPEGPNEIGRLGGYRVIRLLGQGGMGIVLEAEEIRLKRRVALKVMKPEIAAKTQHRQRFLLEAQAAARVEHDHIIPIHQIGEENGVPFIAMPFLKGEPLDARLKRGRLDIPEIIAIGRQTAEGLAAAHEQGLIHRDIKPANIWLEAGSNSSVRVKILDFGLARLSGDEGNLTQSGMILGTPAYMSPEQARSRPVDHRADLFSLGCVLYELSTGKRPFTGTDTMGILSSLALDTPTEPLALNADLPPALSALIMKLLEKDANRRPQKTADIARILKQLMPETTIVVVAKSQPAVVATPWDDLDDTEMISAPELAAPTQTEKERSLKPWWIGLGALAAVMIAAIIFLVVRDKNGKEIAKSDGPGANKGESFNPKDKEPKVVVKAFSPLDPAWITKVQAMTPDDQANEVAAELKRRNPGFDGTVERKFDGGAVTDLQFFTDMVADISPVRVLTKLQRLECGGSGDRNGQLADLSPLKDLKLTYMRFDNTKVSELLPLKDMPLKYLVCTNTPVSDLSPLQDMQLLECSCGGTNISSLSPLANMKELTYLFCYRTQVSDLLPLKDMKLTRLECEYTTVSDLSPLGDMKLTTLACANTKATDLSILKGMPLKSLRCDFNLWRDGELLRSIKTLATINDKPIAEVLKPLDDFNAWAKPIAAMSTDDQVKAVIAELKSRNREFNGNVKAVLEDGVVTGLTFLTDNVMDIAPVRALAGLRRLEVGGSGKWWDGARNGKLADLSPLIGMNLTTFHCAGTLVSDLSSLQDMKLEHLTIATTLVPDLSSLRKMKLKYLHCGKTPISDLTPLEDMQLTEIHFQETKVSDLSPLKDMKLLTTLVCWGTNKVRDLAPLKNLQLKSLSINWTKVSTLEPLKNMKLTYLECLDTPVSDLTWLKDMPLTTLNCQKTPVRDLSALKEMPLKHLLCDFDLWRDGELLRSIKSLEKINEKPAAEILKPLEEFEAWAKKVAAMKPVDQVKAVEDELTRRNPGFNAKIIPKYENAMVTELTVAAFNLTDISPVRALTGLRFLRFYGTGQRRGDLANLWPLRGMNLTNLGFGYTRVTDLSPLRDMTTLVGLGINSTFVRSLAPLEKLKLKGLDCSSNPYVDSLSPLKDMQLENLNCWNTRVWDLTPLQNMQLTRLACRQTGVTDLSPIRGMPLTSLAVNLLNPWRDGEAIRSLPTLKVYDTHENGKNVTKSIAEFLNTVDEFEAWAKQVAAMTPEDQVKAVVKELIKRNSNFDGTIVSRKIEGNVVTELEFFTDNVTDIAPVRALKGLRNFKCRGSEAGKGKLDDLWPLTGMKLQKLDCRWTQVWNVAPLKGMQLTSLDLAETKVADLFPLKNMSLQALNCSSSKVTDHSPLITMPLTHLRCDFELKRDGELLRSIKTLVEINGKPVAEVLGAGIALPPRPTASIVQKFLGHTDAITRVALSGDGKLVLTGSNDRTAILWDAASGKKLQTFLGHTDKVQGVALSGDGKLVLTGSYDKTAILWDAASGKKIQTFHGHTDTIVSLALSGDGRLVLTGSTDKTAILWDAASGKRLQTFLGHTNWVQGVALSGDGKLALTGSADKTAILWDAASGKKIQTFQGHTNWVHGVALSLDGKLVLTGSYDSTAILWDAASGRKLQTFVGHVGTVYGVALSGDGKRALTGSYDSTAILWEATSGKKLQTFQGHTDRVVGAAMSRDGKYVLTGSHDKTAILWAVDGALPLAKTPIDLLPLIDPAKDAVNGAWKFNEKGDLVSDAVQNARIRIPYKPPAEYDLLVSFTKLSGLYGVSQVLVGGGQQFRLDLGAFGNQWSYFGMVDGKPGKENRTAKVKAAWLTTGKRHESRVEVRKDSVKAYIDGALVTELLRTDFKNVNLNSAWDMKAPAVLGLGSWKSPTAFHKVQLVEISGPGTFTRPDDPAARKAAESRRAPQPLANAPGPWRSLFNGKDLTGWQPSPYLKNSGKAEAVIEDGSPALRIAPTYALLSAARFGDYHLRFEYKVEGGNSGGLHFHLPSAGLGLQSRLSTLSESKPRFEFFSYNATLQEAEFAAGKFVPIGRKRSKETLINFIGFQLNPASPWQRVEVLRLGDTFVFRVDGKTVGAVTNVRDARKNEEAELGNSPIGFWADRGGLAQFRNIEIRDISVLPPELLGR